MYTVSLRWWGDEVSLLLTWKVILHSTDVRQLLPQRVHDQDQRSEPEAESQVQSTCDDVLHAVSIPAYETHRWKEDSCSPNLDGDLAQGANRI